MWSAAAEWAAAYLKPSHWDAAMNMIVHAAERNDAPRYALYARFSSTLQDPRSIEDQLHLCRERVAALGGVIVSIHADPSSSGTSMHDRPGLHALLDDAATGKIDAVCAEALDRISRSRADMPRIFSILQYHDVHLITLEEGDIDSTQVGVKGFMNQSFVETLAYKTRRGQIGRAMQGFIPTGNCYGYRLANRIEPDGRIVRGLREIDEVQAATVRRIFELYADGMSARRIAIELNADGIPGPRGGAWRAMTIHGSPRKGTGILNNKRYRGILCFNRGHGLRDPDTNKRRHRPNPPNEWITTEVPEQRIIDDELWERVKKRQLLGIDRRLKGPGARHAPLPLSHLAHYCALCGGRDGNPCPPQLPLCHPPRGRAVRDEPRHSRRRPRGSRHGAFAGMDRDAGRFADGLR